jgi:ABC-type multidrug transport system ATPase subunit
MSEIQSIRFEDLTFQFDENHRILKKCSFSFPMNSVVRIHGPHGCGKSTLLKMLACLVEPIDGRIIINDLVVNEMSFEELFPIRKKIGYAFDYGGLLNNMTIRQNLLLPLRYHKYFDEKGAEAHVARMIEHFGLERSANYRPSAISGGQRKLSCVARSFILSPEVLILDDPTQGLSDRATETLIQMVKEKQKEGSLRHVFLTSENPIVIGELVKRDVVFQEQILMGFDELYQKSILGDSAA